MPLLTNYHLFSFFFHSLNIPYFGRFSFPLRYNGPIYFSLLLNLFVTSVGINNEIYTQLSKNTRQRYLLSPDASLPHQMIRRRMMEEPPSPVPVVVLTTKLPIPSFCHSACWREGAARWQVIVLPVFVAAGFPTVLPIDTYHEVKNH